MSKRSVDEEVFKTPPPKTESLTGDIIFDRQKTKSATFDKTREKFMPRKFRSSKALLKETAYKEVNSAMMFHARNNF